MNKSLAVKARRYGQLVAKAERETAVDKAAKAALKRLRKGKKK